MWCILKLSEGWISPWKDLLLFLSETRYTVLKKSCVRWNQSQLRKERNHQVKMCGSILSFLANRSLSLLSLVCKCHHHGHLAQSMVILSRTGWTLKGKLLLNPGLDGVSENAGFIQTCPRHVETSSLQGTEETVFSEDRGALENLLGFWFC